MHLPGANSQHKKQALGTVGVLTRWGTGVHPPSLRVKFCGRRGLQGGTSGSLQPGQTGPLLPRRAHVSRSTFALRLRAGSGDSGQSPGFRREAARGAHPRAAPLRPSAPSAARPGRLRPVRGRGLAHARGRPEKGARTSSRSAEELPYQSAGQNRLHFRGRPSYSSRATAGGFLKRERRHRRTRTAAPQRGRADGRRTNAARRRRA